MEIHFKSNWSNTGHVVIVSFFMWFSGVFDQPSPDHWFLCLSILFTDSNADIRPSHKLPNLLFRLFKNCSE